MKSTTWNQVQSLEVGSKVYVHKESEVARPGLWQLREGRAEVVQIKETGEAVIQQLQGRRLGSIEILCDPTDFDSYGIEILEDANRLPEVVLLNYHVRWPYPGQERYAVSLEPVGVLKVAGIQSHYRGNTCLERAREALTQAGYQQVDPMDLTDGPEEWRLVKS